MLSDTIGRSVYNAVQVRFKQMWPTRSGGVQAVDMGRQLQSSRNSSTAPDQDVVYNQNAHDNFSPSTTLDRRTGPHPHVQFCEHFLTLSAASGLPMLTRVNSALPTL